MAEREVSPGDLVGVWAGERDSLVFAPDGSGWAIMPTLEGMAPGLRHIRFARLSPGGPFIAREVLVAFLPGTGTQTLRDLPLGRLEAALNRPEERARLEAVIPVTPSVELTRPFPEDLATDEGMPWWIYEVPRPRAPRLRLKGAHDRRKPDEFYSRVAECFGYLAITSTSPAEDLAAAQDPAVPVTTVHGWVKEARRRGLLAAGERSRTANDGEGTA